MVEYYRTYENYILYTFFHNLSHQYGYYYWVITIFVGCLIVGLIFLRSRWIDRLPCYSYMLCMLALVVLFDCLTQLFSIVYLYLVGMGHVLVRSRKEEKELVTVLLFMLSYLVTMIFTYGHKFLWIEIFSTIGIFLWCSWICLRVKKNFFETRKVKSKNAYLVEKLKETEAKLYEYHREIERTYRQDYLTGLYNLNGFQEQVVQGIAQCEEGQKFYVVSIDLTDFKQVNMSEGLDFGDELLLLLATQFRERLPVEVEMARYDGDQFGMGFRSDHCILEECLQTIKSVFQEIREEGILINYCLGVATYPDDTKEVSDLIRLAEQRLSFEQRHIRQKEEIRRQQLEKLSAVGQLAAGLAHEIRNPLTSIRGFVQISAAESAEVKKWESIIIPEIDRINNLLKQFLNLSESRPAQFTSTDLGKLISDVMSLLEPKAFLLGHELVVHKPESPIFIEADVEQMKQVLINLIQNGLDSLGKKKGTVEVIWKKLGNRVILQVKDNGKGIKPEQIPRIFYPFFTTKEEGTGMGLSICHRIISDHQGHIHVTSQPGKGTTFNIHLPITQPVANNSEEKAIE